MDVEDAPPAAERRGVADLSKASMKRLATPSPRLGRADPVARARRPSPPRARRSLLPSIRYRSSIGDNHERLRRAGRRRSPNRRGVARPCRQPISHREPVLAPLTECWCTAAICGGRWGCRMTHRPSGSAPPEFLTGSRTFGFVPRGRCETCDWSRRMSTSPSDPDQRCRAEAPIYDGAHRSVDGARTVIGRRCRGAPIPAQLKVAQADATEVWYVAYGSNLCLDRFTCYLAGGRPQGAARTYSGARDRRPPLDVRPVRLTGTVYFALQSLVWGGAMAFFRPDGRWERCGRAYRLRCSQFADVAAQEMHRDPLADLDLSLLLQSGRWSYGPGRYETIVRLGAPG